MSDEWAEVTEHWRALRDGRGDCCELLARLKEEYDKQHERIIELEREIGMLRGTMERPGEPEEPTRYIHDIPPNAPR